MSSLQQVIEQRKIEREAQKILDDREKIYQDEASRIKKDLSDYEYNNYIRNQRDNAQRSLERIKNRQAEPGDIFIAASEGMRDILKQNKLAAMSPILMFLLHTVQGSVGENIKKYFDKQYEDKIETKKEFLIESMNISKDITNGTNIEKIKINFEEKIREVEEAIASGIISPKSGEDVFKTMYPDMGNALEGKYYKEELLQYLNEEVHPRIMQKFLDAGMDPDIKYQGHSILTKTLAENKQFKTTKLLIEYGADVNEKIGSDCALSFAQSSSETKLLLSAGANIDLNMADGKSISEKKIEKIRDLMGIDSMSVNDKGRSTNFYQTLEILKIHKQQGFDFNEVGSNNATTWDSFKQLEKNILKNPELVQEIESSRNSGGLSINQIIDNFKKEIDEIKPNPEKKVFLDENGKRILTKNNLGKESATFEKLGKMLGESTIEIAERQRKEGVSGSKASHEAKKESDTIIKGSTLAMELLNKFDDFNKNLYQNDASTVSFLKMLAENKPAFDAYNENITSYDGKAKQYFSDLLDATLNAENDQEIVNATVSFTNSIMKEDPRVFDRLVSIGKNAYTKEYMKNYVEIFDELTSKKEMMPALSAFTRNDTTNILRIAIERESFEMIDKLMSLPKDFQPNLDDKTIARAINKAVETGNYGVLKPLMDPKYTGIKPNPNQTMSGNFIDPNKLLTIYKEDSNGNRNPTLISVKEFTEQAIQKQYENVKGTESEQEFFETIAKNHPYLAAAGFVDNIEQRQRLQVAENEIFNQQKMDQIVRTYYPENNGIIENKRDEIRDERRLETKKNLQTELANWVDAKVRSLTTVTDSVGEANIVKDLKISFQDVPPKMLLDIVQDLTNDKNSEFGALGAMYILKERVKEISEEAQYVESLVQSINTETSEEKLIEINEKIENLDKKVNGLEGINALGDKSKDLMKTVGWKSAIAEKMLDGCDPNFLQSANTLGEESEGLKQTLAKIDESEYTTLTSKGNRIVNKEQLKINRQAMQNSINNSDSYNPKT